jgi:hypothetical protein
MAQNQTNSNGQQHECKTFQQFWLCKMLNDTKVIYKTVRIQN